MSELGEASVHGLCVCGGVCVCIYTCICACTDMSVRQGERERKVKLTILFIFGVSSPQIPAGPMVDEWCPSHYSY